MKKPKHILNNIIEIEPPSYLQAVVLRRISEAKIQDARRQKILFRCGFIFSGASIIITNIFFGSDVLFSEFWNIASLGFSDAEIVLANWQSFGLSLLETFPVVAVSFIFTSIFFLLILMKKYSEQEFDMQTFNQQSI
ncbi:MAG TPA: hypothetical protein DEA43_04165 [Candidatus Moranbacteria bacterium]|nr:hypothetical protein [Candidatus Moranbacteria bacterium]HBT46048.1 hypothetical protein [Candidatus Moranbacteria bacterium]